MPKVSGRAKPARSQTAKTTRAATVAGRANGDVRWLTIRGAAHNNLKDIDANFPLGRFVCVTGVSGSGKSSLVNDILYKALARDLNGATTLEPAPHAGLDGLDALDKIISIDQSPIGRTPRSNPATYIKVFDEIRQLFAKLPDAKLRGYQPGRFSFNVAGGRRGGGRCEACEGNGANKIEMDFLADVWVRCPICEGKRFGRETLQIQYKHKSVADVLEMDVQEALEHFENVPRVRAMLQTLHDVGLDYIKLGQASTTLSGGEAQRIKLARELVKKPTGETLYVLDEPTTGLHFDDIRKLLGVLHGFVDAGNTVVVIEHNLDVLKTADWIIDLGPEGGEAGGWIVVEGTPEDVAACEASHTGRALTEALGEGLRDSASERLRRFSSGIELDADAARVARERLEAGAAAPNTEQYDPNAITVVGARQHNLRDLTVSFPRNKTTVCTGVSGSGKSSFAIDTIFAEGHRRYVESLSAYARQFLGQLAKPRVDHVHGLSPAICIEQKSAGKSPRSTVGTITEIYDYMRILWARVGTMHCPRCRIPVGTQTVDEICGRVMGHDAGSPIMLLAPVSLGDGETYAGMFNRLKASGYTRVRIDGSVQRTVEATTLDARRKHHVEVVVDRTVIRPKFRGRISESIEHALALGNGVMTLVVEAIETVHDDDQPDPRASARAAAPSVTQTDERGDESRVGVEDAEPAPLRIHQTPEREFLFSQKLACTQCGTSYEELTPHSFSFNSQLGWCETCEGLGFQRGAPAAAIIKNPSRSLLKGAIAGWPHIDKRSAMGRMLAALTGRLGVNIDAPLRAWTDEQKRDLMFGTESAIGAGSRGTGHDDMIDGSRAFPGLRFHWRGFFPAIDAATRNSWVLRHKLHNVVTDIPCVACRGGRLRPDSAAVRLLPRAAAPRDGAERVLAGKTIVEACEMPLRAAAAYFDRLRLDARQRKIAGELLKEIRGRLRFLVDVGLDYIHLHRSASTLSGGESQRIRLASQIGSGLSGVLYVLDEPTIGLHPRDTHRLVRALAKLRDLGNTLLMVEHDRDVIRSADRLLDFGPRAGRDGGQIVAEGTPQSFLRDAGRAEDEGRSLTRDYLNGTAAIVIPSNRRPVRDPNEAAREEEAPRERSGRRAPPHAAKRKPKGAKQFALRYAPVVSKIDEAVHDWLVVRGARQNNLKNIDVPIPLGRFTCVTGVSGSGKSSLVNDIVWPVLARELNRANLTPGEHDGLSGARRLDKVIMVDQSPIGTTPSSNPATYTGTFDWIRELFARLPDSKMRGYQPNRFSFNRPGGRCEACQGNGQTCIEMHFMADVWVECETCRGRRYNPETLEVRFKGKSIADVLELRVSEALQHFDSVPKVRRMLNTLADVGLEYVQLGQPAPTLSGGEAQRVKLATELGKPDTGRTCYILDEPTTGLHFDDINKLLAVIHRLTDLGNTLIVIEHNLDVIKCADWIIDLGPEAGDEGGYIVAMGTPEEIASEGVAPDPRSGRARAPAVPAPRRHSPQADTSAMVSYTAVALRPVLDAGPREVRERYDPAAHAAREMEVEKQRYGKVGRDTKMPWQIDGRKWHLEQRTSRNEKKTRWESEALDYVVELLQKTAAFAPTNWNNRASVEIKPEGDHPWFFHALTGGEWLLELYFRVPRGTFQWPEIDEQIGLKTLDQRDDLPAYGDWARVDVRPRHGPLDVVVVYVHDQTEIDTPAFRKFVKQAAAAYHRSQQPAARSSAAKTTRRTRVAARPK